MFFLILTIYQYSKFTFFKIFLLVIMCMLMSLLFFTYASVAFHSSKSYEFKGQPLDWAVLTLRERPTPFS